MSNSTTLEIPTPQELAEAFKVFTDASNRLEHRYMDLQREAEELRVQLRQKDEEIKRSERLATLGEMAAALAHEIRNPLGAMKLFLSILRSETKASATAETTIAQLDVSIESLDAIVSNILHFSKNKAPTLSVVNLSAILHSLLPQFQTLYPEVRWSLQNASSGEIFVRGNEHALRQVFHNLLLNAAQAMRGKGSCTTHLYREETGVRVRVIDSGPGISEAVKSRLFEPFVTTKSEGTGLGLAVVKQILTQHGATIRVVPDVNSGAVFDLQFSISSEKALEGYSV